MSNFKSAGAEFVPMGRGSKSKGRMKTRLTVFDILSQHNEVKSLCLCVPYACCKCLDMIQCGWLYFLIVWLLHVQQKKPMIYCTADKSMMLSNRVRAGCLCNPWYKMAKVDLNSP